MSAPGSKCVFCKDCRHYGGFQERYVLGRRDLWQNACLVGKSETNPIEGQYTLPVDAEEKNKHYNCDDFEPIPPKMSWKKKLLRLLE